MRTDVRGVESGPFKERAAALSRERETEEKRDGMRAERCERHFERSNEEARTR